jgi:hypothetical protein
VLAALLVSWWDGEAGEGDRGALDAGFDVHGVHAHFPGSLDRAGDGEEEGGHIYPGCRATRWSSVKAAVGDRITVHGLHVGDATRCGEVLEVKGADGESRYVVRWDDGHEAVFVPGSGVRVDPADAAADGEPG